MRGNPGSPNKSGFYFGVGDRERGEWSHFWRVWSDRTSFYITARGLTGHKLSFHGPDEKHSCSGWKLAPDDSRASPGIASLVGPGAHEPQWFEGVKVSSRTHFVFRARFPWTVFEGNLSRGLGASKIKKTMTGALIRLPQQFHAVDVDFFVSDQAPYWPDPRQARIDNAKLPPLTNEAGQILTAVAVQRSVAREPHPSRADLLPPTSSEDSARGIWMGLDDDRPFAWAVETAVSRRALARLPGYRSPRVDPSLLLRQPRADS